MDAASHAIVILNSADNPCMEPGGEMSIVAEGKFTFADIWSGTILAMRRILIWMSVTGAAVLADAVMETFRSEGGARNHLQLYAGGVFLLAYLWPVIAYGCYRTLKRSPNLQGTVKYDFDDSGYRLEAARSRAEVQWGALVKWREGRRTILLYSNPRIGSVVPKRFFKSAADVDTVREYLRANVKSK